MVQNRLQQKRITRQYHKTRKTDREVQERQHQQNQAASVIQKAVSHFLLSRRTLRAHHHLLTYKHMSAILDALKNLEVVIQVSPLCCGNIAKDGVISTIFVVVRSCNQSVPCMEVAGHAAQVLLNVAKYGKTKSAVYDAENCVDTLLELLQMYREKPGDRAVQKSGSIFKRTCCLLAVLLKTERLLISNMSQAQHDHFFLNKV